MNPELVGAWVAAGLTLFMFSFLYRDNPFFKLGEHVFVGISVGYTLVITWYEFLEPKWWLPLFADPLLRGAEPKWWLLVPTFFGLAVLTRFVPRIAWLSRYAFALLVGYAAGLAIPNITASYLLKQLEGTVVPLWGAGEPWGYFSSLVLLAGVIATLVYFFYSVEHRGAIHVVSRAGVYFLMVSFGAGFGFTVMARNALLFGRLYDLVDFAGADYGHATLWLLGGMVATLFVWARWFAPQDGDAPS